MLFEEIFLEKADLQKFQMFRALTAFDAANLTITDLSNRLDLSYQQSYNIYQELIEDVQTITGKSRAASKKALTDPANLPFTVDDYRYRLLQDSTSFQFLDYLVQGNHPSVHRFCTERFISRSTLMRKTTELRQFLHRYGIKLSLTKPALVGDEGQIRLFLNTVYWLGCHGAVWPFTSIHMQTIQTQYFNLATAKTNPINAIQEMLFWALCRIRIAHGYTVRHSVTFDRIFGDYPAFKPAIYPPTQFPNVPAEALQSESSFFYFFQLKTIQFDRPLPCDIRLLKYVQHQNGAVWQFIDRLADYLHQYIEQQPHQDLRDNTDLTLNVVRVTLSYILMNGNYVKQADFFSLSRVTYKQRQFRTSMAAFIDQLPDEPDYLPLRNAKTSFVELLFYLFVPHLQGFRWDDTVKVKMMMETNDVLNRRLADFLDNLNIVARLGDTDTIESADLVITSLDDFIEPSAKQYLARHPSAVFHWYLDANEADYYLLYQKIHALYLAKLEPSPA